MALDITTLRERIDDPEPLLRQIGAKLVSSSQRAFDEQKFGGVKWPPRYPNQTGGPFINVAGAVSDLSNRGRIRKGQFDRRPALRQTGNLFRSVKDRVVAPNAVEVGSVTDYANIHQFGGTSRMPVTQIARDALKKETKRARDDKKKALRRLGFIFNVDTLTTRINPRPFIGIPDEERGEVLELASDFFNKK